MSDDQHFEGEVVRIEASGFGVVKFNRALGANTHGVFSTDLSTFKLPVEAIHAGMHVEGTAQVDDKQIAAIRVLTVSE
jgi:hypothetical protein